MAKLNFYYGAMTCGKSERLISAARNYTIRKKEIVTIMPELAMRESGFTTSREENGAWKRWPIDIATNPGTELYETYHQHVGERAIQAVFVDEAQFMTEKQIDDLERIAKIDDTSVIAYGLKGNVQRKLFEGSKRLLELADRTEKIITICECGQQAEYNGRFVEGTFHVGEPIVWIDTPDNKAEYDAMCADCYLANMEKPGAILA